MCWIQRKLQVNAVSAIKRSNFWLFMAGHFKLLWKLHKGNVPLKLQMDRAENLVKDFFYFKVSANQAFSMYFCYVYNVRSVHQ